MPLTTRIELDLDRYKQIGQEFLNQNRAIAKQLVIIIAEHQKQVMELAMAIQQGTKDKEAATRAIERLNMAFDLDLKSQVNLEKNAGAEALKKASKEVLDFVSAGLSFLVKAL